MNDEITDRERMEFLNSEQFFMLERMEAVPSQNRPLKFRIATQFAFIATGAKTAQDALDAAIRASRGEPHE